MTTIATTTPKEDDVSLLRLRIEILETQYATAKECLGIAAADRDMWKKGCMGWEKVGFDERLRVHKLETALRELRDLGLLTPDAPTFKTRYLELITEALKRPEPNLNEEETWLTGRTGDQAGGASRATTTGPTGSSGPSRPGSVDAATPTERDGPSAGSSRAAERSNADMGLWTNAAQAEQDTEDGPPRKAAVSLIQREDGRVLCVLNLRYGGFALPGGMVEPGESVETALRRELDEETSLQLTTAVPIFEGPHNLRPKHGDRGGRANIVSLFRVTAQGEPRETEKGCSIAWLTWEEFLAQTPFAAFYRAILPKLSAGPKAGQVEIGAQEALWRVRRLVDLNTLWNKAGFVLALVEVLDATLAGIKASEVKA